MRFISRLGLIATAACLFVVASPFVGAQSNATLSGPVLGYVFSAPEGALRPVRGILGSATVGDPEPLNFTISQALNTDSRHVIVSTSANPELLVVGFETSGASATAIAGVPSNPSQASVSRNGTAAACYYADSQRLLIVAGLPAKPTLSHLVDLSDLNGRQLTHIAVSDDGLLAVYSVAEIDRESVYVWTSASASSSASSAESNRFVFSVAAAGGIAIAANGTAIVTDRGANEIYAIPEAHNASIAHFLLGERDGLSAPSDVAISASGEIYVANRGSGNVLVLDSSGRLLRTRQCSCALSGLYLLGDDIFRLTDRLDRTIYLLQAGAAFSSEDRILFVPALRDTPH